MSRTTVAIVAATLLALAPVIASGAPDLRVKRAPVRLYTPSLAIRSDSGTNTGSAGGTTTNASGTTTSATTTNTSGTGAGADTATTGTGTSAATIAKKPTKRFDPIPTDLTDLSERVTFRFQIGYGSDQAQLYTDSRLPSGEPLLNEETGGPNRNTRLYTFGDAVIGTRGIATPSLLTYFAAHFYLDQDGRPESASIPTVYDGAAGSRAVLIRSSYAQLDGMQGKYLRHLFVRAGRQFRYGLAITHFDGLSTAWESRAIDLSVYFGRRVALYGPGSDPFAVGDADPGVVSGSSMKLRLAAITAVPLTLGFEFFTLDRDQQNFEGSLRVDATRNVVATAAARVRGSALAHWRGALRARMSRTTTVALEVDHRRAADWIYDLIVPADTGRPLAADDALRRLSLGPPVSRFRVGLRAGTMLFDNFDVLVFAAAARQQDTALTSVSPTYAEIGMGLEARFRAGLSTGVELRGRRYLRADAGLSAPFGDTAAAGERTYQEGAVQIRYALGARRFTGEVEAYARTSSTQTIYEDQATTDNRGGGRFRIEGWVSRRLHVLAEYELTGVPDRQATELAGLQSLRVLAEASF